MAILTEAEVEGWFAEKSFTSNWTKTHYDLWLPLFGNSRELPIQILEIGSWEGRSALFFLNYLPKSHIVCIDTFAGATEHKTRPDYAPLLPGLEQRFDANLAPFAGRFEKIKAMSSTALPRLAFQGRRFDLVYIDGSHRAADVYSDAALAWPMLNPLGIAMFDDYLWPEPLSPEEKPQLGIDSFLKAMAGQYACSITTIK